MGSLFPNAEGCRLTAESVFVVFENIEVIE